MTRLFVAALALLGVVTGLTGCGGGSGSETLNPLIRGSVSPDAFVSPVTRQYEGAWSGTYNSSDGAAVALPMELTFRMEGNITGALAASPTNARLVRLDAWMTGDDSFTGAVSQTFGTLTQDGSYSNISGTLRLENGRLVGEYRSNASPGTVISFVLEKK